MEGGKRSEGVKGEEACVGTTTRCLSFERLAMGMVKPLQEVRENGNGGASKGIYFFFYSPPFSSAGVPSSRLLPTSRLLGKADTQAYPCSSTRGPGSDKSASVSSLAQD